MPKGEAPEKIRKEWVGLILPLYLPEQLAYEVSKSKGVAERGVETGQAVSQDEYAEGGYAVSLGDAVRELAIAGKTEAADYWTERGASFPSRFP